MKLHAESPVLHAESSWILHAKEFLLYFTWPLILHFWGCRLRSNFTHNQQKKKIWNSKYMIKIQHANPVSFLYMSSHRFLPECILFLLLSDFTLGSWALSPLWGNSYTSLRNPSLTSFCGLRMQSSCIAITIILLWQCSWQKRLPFYRQLYRQLD